MFHDASPQDITPEDAGPQTGDLEFDAAEEALPGPETPEAVEAAVAILELMSQRGRRWRLQRRLVRISNIYAPQEVSAIYRLLAENTSAEGQALLARIAPQWRQYLAKPGAVFHREPLAPGAVLFRSAKEGPERGGLVCFAAGPDHSMFMANSRFLDMFGHLPMDILLLARSNGTFGKWTFDGAGSIQTSLVRLKAVLAARGVVPRCYVGASAGGEVALVAATLDPSCTGIGLSGRFYAPGRKIALAEAGPAFLPLCACWPGKLPELHAIYGADEPVDVDNHRLLQALAPHARVHPIPRDSRHNPLASMAARGKLRAVMDQIAEAGFGRPARFDMASAL